MEQLNPILAAVEGRVHIQRGGLRVDELDKGLVLFEPQLLVLVMNRFQGFVFLFGDDNNQPLVGAPRLVTLEEVEDAVFYYVHQKNTNICSSDHKSLLNRL